ncbi:MAG: GerAB/ArcD/ProY family transporter [Bacillota bacterium]|nr:GerAB/ArcD/ProY family transporter [Bacillota bacterium]
MEAKSGNITSKQAFVFIMAAQIGIGILSLPASLAKIMGHDGWIAVALAGILNTIATIIIVSLLRRYKDKSIVQINQLLYGKILGLIFNIIFIFYFTFITASCFRYFMIIIKLLILQTTPSVFLSFCVMTPIAYLVWYGIKPVCRFSSILFINMLIVLVMLALLYNNIRITYLMPIGEVEMNSILSGIRLTTFSFLGFELMAVIYPNITDKDKAMKYAVAANITTSVFYLLVVVICTAFFGENLLKMLVIPLFSLIQAYRTPILDRIDLFFIAFWFPLMGCTVRNNFYCSWDCLCRIINMKNKKIYFILFTILLIILSRIPKNFVDANKYVNYSGLLGIGVILFLVFSYFFSFINKRGTSK